MAMQSINPATDELIAEFDVWDDGTLEAVLTEVDYNFMTGQN